MGRWVFFCSLFLWACGDDPAKNVLPISSTDSAVRGTVSEPSTIDTQPTHVKDTSSHASYAPKVVKKPSGIYELVLFEDGNQRILHTIDFKPGTYRLQEEYLGKKDSIVITEGTWAPSRGYIWLYRDQLVRGRYVWKGDTLQYFDPKTNGRYVMSQPTPIAHNTVWQTKKKEGALLYAIGTEPFWNIEINRRDSASMGMPDWTSRLRVKLASISKHKDSTVYVGEGDSLRIVVYPYFCSDDMSDFSYPNKVKVYYKGQLYSGCGTLF